MSEQPSIYDLDDLRKELNQAMAVAKGELPCPLCDYIRAMPDGAPREAVTEASAGTIGVNKLELIFRRRGVPAARKLIERHRKEEHQP